MAVFSLLVFLAVVLPLKLAQRYQTDYLTPEQALSRPVEIPPTRIPTPRPWGPMEGPYWNSEKVLFETDSVKIVEFNPKMCHDYNSDGDYIGTRPGPCLKVVTVWKTK